MRGMQKEPCEQCPDLSLKVTWCFSQWVTRCLGEGMEVVVNWCVIGWRIVRSQSKKSGQHSERFSMLH